MRDGRVGKCGHCGERAVAWIAVRHEAESGDLHDAYSVENVPALTCGSCGRRGYGEVALEMIEAAHTAAIRKWCQEHKPGPDYFEAIGGGRMTMQEWWDRRERRNSRPAEGVR